MAAMRAARFLLSVHPARVECLVGFYRPDFSFAASMVFAPPPTSLAAACLRAFLTTLAWRVRDRMERGSKFGVAQLGLD